MQLVKYLEDLGKITDEITYPLFTQYTLHLHRPVPTYEPHAAPDCCFINDELWACTRYDYLRTQGSIILPRKELIQVRFVDRPVAWWVGYGRLAHKAVESIEIAVYGSHGDTGMERFVDLARIGFAYEGATSRRRKR